MNHFQPDPLHDGSSPVDCFISYRRADGFFAAKMIRDQLESLGISCFLDLEESKAGNINNRIKNAIANCENFILILSPAALDRCVHEEDWVRQEIEAAMELKKTIIPIQLHGFVWSSQLSSLLPPSLQTLEQLNSVILSTEYFEASVDRLVSFLLLAPGTISLGLNIGQNVADFFKYSLDSSQNVSGVDMAFHVGSYWYLNNEKIDILQKLMEHHIPVRVIIQSEYTSEEIVQHMRKQMKWYIPLEDNFNIWRERSANYPELLEVRVCSLPILHRTYLVHRKDGTGSLSLKNYRYGDGSSDNQESFTFDGAKKDWEMYQAYRTEFNYMWNHLCTPLADFLKEREQSEDIASSFE